MRLPTVDSWNFSIERQFGASTVLSVAYVGNHGYYVTAGGTNYNINQPSIVGFGTLNTNQRRLFYPRYGWTQSIKYFADDATTKFNSLQVRGEKRSLTAPPIAPSRKTGTCVANPTTPSSVADPVRRTTAFGRR